ncbi:hypothetical protein [Helicobacter cappadocius]|uniref:Tail fiber protein n=1 Tax=Helicobacter cappadocius TaxID=3063998 RepID=A0AA90TFK8_9HELI|nr:MULTISPECIES: hypothetical protein [unclassified Helicobacter]MDO7253889.1 hypothetical protein [Helicobacter sp. faydin-H75]MDP2539750.1 hypothetical protein [Helicobacter sp. faydin-H76]
MQKIQSILNNLTSKEILESIREQNTQALFVGSKNPNDEVLENSLCDPNITLEELKTNAFITTDIRRAYFDEEGCLSFEVNLDYEISSENTIYALAIVSDKSVFLVANTPKIKKMQGIGGSFIIKTSIEGMQGEMIFKSDDYISSAEFEPFRVFVSDFKGLLEEFEYQARLKMLLLDLENYLDTEIAKEKQKLEKINKIGRKDYFYRNSLPSDYVGMGIRLKRDEYPLLWYHTLGCMGNDGGAEFSIPPSGKYSKGASQGALIGEIGKSGLPNITGNLRGGCDNLSGDGVFKNSGRTGWSWSGGHGGNDNNAVDFDASRSSPIYGRSEDVQVDRVHYLEGIYAGQNPLCDFLIKGIK